MKIAVVICEYNPFQKGHVYLLAESARLTESDRTVCVMSGNFTQRGEPAIADKYARAQWALRGGADAVVELPPQYVLSSAQFFAIGGVRIAAALEGDVTLCFGSECGNTYKLKEIAEYEESQNFKRALNEYLAKGTGYAKSYAQAMRDLNEEYADIISSPNNILAIEYLKAIKSTNSDIGALSIKREGGGYLDSQYNDIYSSAGAVRAMLKKGDNESVKKSVPEFVYESLKDFDYSDYTASQDKIFALLKYIAKTRDLSSIHGVKEGIENRITAALAQSRDKEELAEKLSTKRYTDSYLARTLINILLDNRFDAETLKKETPQFVNVLAVKENSKDILSAFKCRVNVKNSTLPNGSLIAAADRLYSSVRSNIPDVMITLK